MLRNCKPVPSIYYALAAFLALGSCQGLQTPATSDPRFPTTLPAEAAGYVLSFSDAFTGTELDTSKWRPRSLGKRKKGVVVEQASTLNGNGQLAMTLTQVGAEYHIAQI
ncbi:MAG: hypothetical protein OTI37_04745, partial [Planctomycetota bacterium]|nr:hypothetical protein [Planctomycetota bacterium]